MQTRLVMPIAGFIMQSQKRISEAQIISINFKRMFNENSISKNGNGTYSKDTNGQFTSSNNVAGAATLTLNEEDKINLISKHFRQIMILLGLDLNDDSLKGTPGRVAKMYVKEIFSGLNPHNKPHVTLFENEYHYGQMLVEKNITVYSYCEHHFVPIIGKAHVAYYPGDKVIGLSKINRIVQFYCKRPQVQERLTRQIAEALKSALHTEDVAVVVDAVHLCVTSRGIGDVNSSTITAFYGGRFQSDEIKKEFLSFTK